VKVLVTGADGFVGRHLVPRLVSRGYQVVAGCRPDFSPVNTADMLTWEGVHLIPFELTDPDRIQAAVSPGHDIVIHLAAVSSVREAREDPGRAWLVNAAGTSRLVNAVDAARRADRTDPLVLIISTAEVYGCGTARPRLETDVPRPQSTYAASKLGSEIAGLEVWRRTGLRVVVARPFTHTGPGQAAGFVVPSFIRRLLAIKSGDSPQVPTGNLDPIRDFLDVRDVVDAYLHLVDTGSPGEIYNVACGEGISLRDLFFRVAELIGVDAEPNPDPALVRSADIPHLVGNAGKLRETTGWSPSTPLDQTLLDMVNAQTH